MKHNIYDKKIATYRIGSYLDGQKINSNIEPFKELIDQTVGLFEKLVKVRKDFYETESAKNAGLWEMINKRVLSLPCFYDDSSVREYRVIDIDSPPYTKDIYIGQRMSFKEFKELLKDIESEEGMLENEDKYSSFEDWAKKEVNENFEFLAQYNYDNGEDPKYYDYYKEYMGEIYAVFIDEISEDADVEIYAICSHEIE